MQTAITRTSGPGRVLLVDDHPAVRRVLRSLLEEVGGWQVVGEADSGEAAIPLVEQLAPDVVPMDCRMPGAGGVAATREIMNRWPEVAVVATPRTPTRPTCARWWPPGPAATCSRATCPRPSWRRCRRPGRARPGCRPRPPGRSWRTCASCTRPRSTAPRSWRPRTPTSARRWPGWRRSTASRTSSWPWSATSCGPDHGRPRHGPDPGRTARHGRHRRRPGDPPAGRPPGQTPARHGRAAPPGERVRGQPQPGAPRRLRGAADGVGNLVDNAGKHAPPGTPIRVLVGQPRGLTRIEVVDQGEGVAEVDRERIFGPFTQLDASTTRRVGGVGLGLFLVERLVRGMGGKVWVEDNPGGGARFVVELPDLAPV